MNSLKIILEFSLFGIGMVIFFMSILAYFNRDKEQNKNDQMHSLDLFWIFHEEYYNEYGKSLCRFGRKLTFVALFLLIIWLVIRFVV